MPWLHRGPTLGLFRTPVTQGASRPVSGNLGRATLKLIKAPKPLPYAAKVRPATA
jgi:hypothetical protein